MICRPMNSRVICIITAGMLLYSTMGVRAQTVDRPRVIVLTDFFKDPDDKQSLIRFLVSANEFEVQGLIATSLAFGDGAVHPEWIQEMIDDYARVEANLRRHERPGYTYPSADHLKLVVKRGASVIRSWTGANRGFPVPYPPGARDNRSCDPVEDWIGPGKDTEASEHIIRVVDQDDERPVWVIVWGGAMDLAQALWKVRHERPADAVDRFVEKLRVYQISWQDTGAVWIWNEFPGLFRIQNSNAMRGIYAEGPPEMRDEAWVNRNVRNDHGPLGAQYPRADRPGIKEGDTPSFLHLLSPGLGDPELPELGGWGGRFDRLDPSRNSYVEALDDHPGSTQDSNRSQWTVGRWNVPACNDFAARMDWCVKNYDEANHHPVVVVEGDTSQQILQRTVRAGQSITFSASGTRDPDSDDLNYRWWHYAEAGSFRKQVELQNAATPIVTLVAPRVEPSTRVHLILEVTDSGEPPLTGYRRVIMTVDPD